MEHWNNHSIRRQKLWDTIHGIPDVLFKNPEIVGENHWLINYLFIHIEMMSQTH